MTSSISPRSRVRRMPKNGRYDRESVVHALDRGLVAHVGFCDGDQPYCVPTLYALAGDEIVIHGSSASRMVRRLASGAPACVTVTTLDALVLARSAFEHSANYESVVVLGRFRVIDDPGEKLATLETLTNALVPGRWDEVRQPDRKELKATAVLGLGLDDASVKLRDGPPSDDTSPDASLDVWAGVVPLRTDYGAPVPSPGLRCEVALSPSIGRFVTRGRSRQGTDGQR